MVLNTLINLTVSHFLIWAFLIAQFTYDAGGPGSIPGLGRSNGEGTGYPLQYSDLETSMDSTVHGITKSQTWLSDFHFTSLQIVYLRLKVDLPMPVSLSVNQGLITVPNFTGWSWGLNKLTYEEPLQQYQAHSKDAAAAKSLQSCPTLCDPIDVSPPGSAIPGILQARTLEWVAISFSNAWKWKVKVKSLSRVWLPATPWTTAHQAPLPVGFSRQE